MSTPKERKQKFAEAYAGPAEGNGVKAAEMAGFTGANASLRVTASRLLRDSTVLAVIANIRAKVANTERKQAEKAERPKIADAAERRRILTRMARLGVAKKASASERIAGAKAIDILNRMDGVYVTKVEDVTPEAKKKARVLRNLPDDVLKKAAEAVH